MPLVNAAVGALEGRQVENGIGIAKNGELSGLARAFAQMSAEKHGNKRLADLLETVKRREHG